MQVLATPDPIETFNARAKAAGWTFTCELAHTFERPELANALALWRGKAGSRAMPERSEMTAREMKPYLTNMTLLERVGCGESARYRARLHGTALARYAGDKTGLYLEDFVPAGLLGSYSGVFDTVLELARPLRVVRHFQAPPVDYLVGESLVAPLSVAGKDVPIILSVTFVEPRSKISAPKL